MKMKQLSLLILFVMGTFSVALAQISIADVAALHQQAIYLGGQDTLAREFYLNTRYAASAQRQKKIGTLVGILKVSNKGEIVEIGSLNKAFPDFKDEFERVTRTLTGDWSDSNGTALFSYAVIPIQFSIPGDGYTLRSKKLPAFVYPPVLISAHWSYYDKEKISQETAAAHYKKMEKDLVKQVRVYSQKGEYGKAIELQEELVNLQPFDVTYYATLADLHQKQGNTAESHYYQQVQKMLKP